MRLHLYLTLSSNCLLPGELQSYKAKISSFFSFNTFFLLSHVWTGLQLLYRNEDSYLDIDISRVCSFIHCERWWHSYPRSSETPQNLAHEIRCRKGWIGGR